MKKVGFALVLAAAVALVMSTTGITSAQNNWASFGQDPGATKFSTLSQINTDNVKNLTRAWTFHTGDTSGFFESGLMVIDGVMYFSAQNGVYALDAATGKQMWKYATTGTARRGPYYWPGGSGVGPRIFSQTENGLAAIDPKDGKLITSFGEKGFITGLRMSSPPVAYKNILVTQGGNSTVKAWDTVTGEPRWVLNLKAQPGDPAADTWLGDSLKTAGGPGLWGYFSVDVERGLIFVPVEKVGNDYYGGRITATTSTATACSPWTRTRARSSGTSSSCITTSGTTTWRRRRRSSMWRAAADDSRRLAHHEDGHHVRLQPRNRRADVRHGGASCAADDRQRRVDVADAAVPDQAGPLARMSIKKEELAKVTPELEALCKGLWEKYNLSDTVPYNPWKETQDIVVFPGAVGGGNWQGVMFNKPLGLMITNVMNAGQWGHLEERAAGASSRRWRGACAAPVLDAPVVPASRRICRKT